MMRRTLALIAFVLISVCLHAHTQDIDRVTGTAFRRYHARDQFGRTITYYLSEAPAGSRPVPLAVWIQGTGCSSVFERVGSRISQGPQTLVHEAMGDNARVLVVEKPGVEFLDVQESAGNARTCRAEFLKEHTLERWSEAIATSIKAAWKLPGIDATRALVMGGSEGGVVAVRVSNLLPSVTHAVSVAGGGPNHLFILADFVRRKELDPEEEVYKCWAEIVKNPDSATNFCFGQPFRLWSSLLKTSLIEECLRSHAQLYLLHGTADEQSPIAAFDVMQAELTAHGRKAVFERVPNGSHALATPGQDPGDALLAAFRHIAAWFLIPKQ